MDYQTLMGYVPLPNILESKKVLFVGPHPDDIEIACGGLVSELVDLGVKVKFLIVTDGGSGSNDSTSIEKIVQTRKDESIKSAKFLRIDGIDILDFPDGGIYDTNLMATEIAKKILDFKPDTVLCPDPLLETEIHPDHINCASATKRALIISRFRNSAIRHGIAVDNDFKPAKGMNLVYYYTNRHNTIIPVSQTNFEKKLESIMIHKSQIDSSFEGIKMYLYFKATTLGKEVGSKYAEGYFAMSPVHQHCFLEKI